jgi:protein arginine kinase
LLERRIDGESIWIGMNEATPLVRLLLRERHLASRDLAPNDPTATPAPGRAVAFGMDETVSVMINEEDHLRLQAISAGHSLMEAWERVRNLDRALEDEVGFAVSDRYGYLTGCPTNVGTGLRASVMLHLPALGMVRPELEKVFAAAQRTGLAVRGMYGEGSRAAGDFYQISNQITLGRSEEQLLSELKDKILPRIIEYERQARRVLVERNETLLDDRTQRALGILRSARLLGAEEAMKLLSRVRLALCLSRLEEIDPGIVNQLFLQVQPAHLQLQADGPLSADQLREMRATVVREALSV